MSGDGGGGALAVVVVSFDVVVPVWPSIDVLAPPELPYVTSGPVGSVIVTVLCDNGVGSVGVPGDVVVWPPVVVDPDTVAGGGVESEESPDVFVVFVLSVVFVASGSPVDVVDGSSSVAHATPGEVAIAVPIPSARASAPTRPMYLA
jgi:hypothetical protein